jgi:hypothetical protein
MLHVRKLKHNKVYNFKKNVFQLPEGTRLTPMQQASQAR